LWICPRKKRPRPLSPALTAQTLRDEQSLSTRQDRELRVVAAAVVEEAATDAAAVVMVDVAAVVVAAADGALTNESSLMLKN
jgi:hypothetical protein